MAVARTYGPILELPLHDRRVRLILILLAVLLLIAFAVWPRGDTVDGYAYPIPGLGEDNTIEVLNGTDRRGLARGGTRLLRANGFDVVFFGNARTPTDTTLILVGGGSDADALGKRLRQVLGAGVVRQQLDTLRRVAATVVLGADYQGPQELHP